MQTTPARILVVDDETTNLKILENILHDQYQLIFAKSAIKAVALAEELLPDLILMDIMMPGVNGYEACQQLRTKPGTAHIPLIFVTAMGEEQDELQGLALGAVDYITKPISSPILKARVKTHLALKNARQILNTQKQWLEAEMALIEDLLNRMRHDERFDKRAIRFFSVSLERTNGDVVMSASRSDGAQHIFVGDFTGHGLRASMGAPLVLHIFYAMTDAGACAEDIFRELNKVLSAKLPVNIFLAGCLVEIAPDRHSFRLWNAGLPDAMLLTHPNTWLSFPSSLLPLGVMSDCRIDTTMKYSVVEGDKLYLFTDGVTETMRENGAMFGKAALTDAIEAMLKDDLPIGYIKQCLDGFAVERPIGDDTTVLEIDFS